MTNLTTKQKKAKERMKKREAYKKCVRCGSVGMMCIDFGLIGKLWMCSVCWIGLAGAMYKDFKIYLNDDVDYIHEFKKSLDRENWMKENNK